MAATDNDDFERLNKACFTSHLSNLSRASALVYGLMMVHTGLLFSLGLDFDSIIQPFLAAFVTGKLARLLSAPQTPSVLVWLFFASILFLPGAYGVFGAALVAYCLGASVFVRPRIFKGLDWIFVGLLFCYPLLLLPSAFVMGARYSFFDYPVRALLFIPVVRKKTVFRFWKNTLV